MPEEQFKRGQENFVQHCAFCHGRNATGGSNGPNLTRSAVMRHDINGEEIGKVIRLGRPDKGMPPIPLNETQISDVAAYLHARLAIADKISARRPGADFESKNLLTGSAEKGKAYFNGAGECASCHSPSGDLRGIAGKYSAAALEARFLYPSGKRPTATVTDASGKRFSGEVLAADDFDVAIRTADGWYHSWPARSVTVDIHDPLAKHAELLPKFTTQNMRDLLAYLETLK
jgi:cytochrome c oxidase cbb3-type subunit 3